MQHNKTSPLLPFSNLLHSHKKGEELQAFSLPAVPSFRQRPVRVRPLLIRILLLYPHRVLTRTKIIYPIGVYLSRESYYEFYNYGYLQLAVNHSRLQITTIFQISFFRNNTAKTYQSRRLFTASAVSYKERPACRHHFATRQTAASVFHTPTGTVFPATLYPATDTDMLPVRQCRRLR